GLFAHHSDEEVGDAGGTDIAKVGELLTIHTIEEQDAAAEDLALVNRLELPRRCGGLGIHHHFHIARFELFGAAAEYDATAIHEHDIGENVLNLVDLMCGDHVGPSALDVIA